MHMAIMSSQLLLFLPTTSRPLRIKPLSASFPTRMFSSLSRPPNKEETNTRLETAERSEAPTLEEFEGLKEEYQRLKEKEARILEAYEKLKQEYEKLKEEKARQGFGKAFDAFEEAVLGEPRVETVKERYKEPVGKGNFHKPRDD